MHRIGFRVTSLTARAATSSSASRIRSSWGTRQLHQRQQLPYPEEEGLGKFLPPEALKVQLEYQDGLLERLNDEVIATAEAGSSIVQTIINLSGRQDKILAFNYASLALNNSFFLNNLKPPSDRYPNYEHEINSGLGASIRLAYGNIQQLRSSFSAAALGTFINGWIWFVMDQNNHLGIVPTYGAETLLIRSRANMETTGQITPNHSPTLPTSQSPIPQPPPPGTSPASPVSGISGESSPSISKPSGARFRSSDAMFSSSPSIRSAEDANTPQKPIDVLNAGETLYPLFCVPVYEHAWMSAGFGVWGKEQWLKEFWSVLNWKKIDATFTSVQKANAPKDQS